MKIAMIGHKQVPSRDGGIEVVVGELATRLVTLGNDVILYNRKRKTEKINEYNGAKIENVFTINKKSLDAIVYAWFATSKAKKLAKKGQLDIIHYHAEGTCAFISRFPKKSKRNYKLIVTIHGLDWQRSKWGNFASKFLLHCEKQVVKYADEIIVLSKNIKEYFLSKYGREVTYLPNGTNPVVLREPDLITKKWDLHNKDYLLFLARIVPEKGLHYLIDAWKEVLIETNTNKKLVIAGSSSHSDEYYNSIIKAAKGVESIIFTGFVQGQVLEELYSNAYLYILPSDVEGMSVSLLEAISYGNVCLVSDIPENIEVITNDSLTFKHGNVEDLKEKIIYFLNAQVNSHLELPIGLDWDEVTRKTLEIYKNS